MQIHWLKINNIIEETPEIKTYMLDLPDGFTWEEGAHTHLALEGFNAGEKPNRSLVRHMSICTLPSERSIGITTRIKEQCSEFKAILRSLHIGQKVALFKTHSNIPLKREGKNIYLLSSGVGLATFRPLVLAYLENTANIKRIHSLNIDSTTDFLYPLIFRTDAAKNFIAQFVAQRKEYYDEVRKLAVDRDGLFYVVGSDEFLMQNIQVLREQGIKPEQIVLDKHESQRVEFLPADVAI